MVGARYEVAVQLVGESLPLGVIHVQLADGPVDGACHVKQPAVSFELSGAGTDLLTGIRHSGRLDLDRYGVAVLASPRSEAIPFATLAPPLHDHDPKEEA